ncbi:MAG TPA: hypothetical protein VGL65_05805 [Gemmatimonadales bacterium]
MYVATAYVNIGVVAMDDYDWGVAHVVPAQNQDNADIIAHAGIRSPVSTLVLVSVSRIAERAGFKDPVSQYRFVLLVTGIFAYCMLTFFARRHFRLRGGLDKERIVLLLIGFFWLAPYFFSRPMIEALAAPFVTASACFACEYWVNGERRALVLSVFALMIAATFRFQAGVCFLAIVATFVLRRQWKDAWVLAVASAVAFLIPGLLDLALRGRFYASLTSYIAYNVAHSSSYGVTPFYSFATLFLAISIPPAFWLRYRELRWREEFRPILPTVLFFAVFLVAHSAVPHKEDRFMVPILPSFLICLTPLANYVVTHHRLRAGYFVVVNAFLLVITSFTVEQRNTIGLVRYLAKRPEITRIVGVDGTLVLYPTAYALHSPAESTMSAAELVTSPPMDCNTVVAIRSGLKAQAPNLAAGFHKLAQFQPGLLEQLVIWINPGPNARRTTIELYEPKGCGRTR